MQKKKSLITFPDGCKYTGMTKVNKKDNKLIPHGLGFAQWPDKQSYQGQYKNGKFDGWGHYKAPNSHEFIGVWSNGFFKKGEWKKYDGQHYVGEFKKSEFHGTGTMNYSGNYKYEGQWKDNTAHGKGKVTYLKNFEKGEKGEVWKGSFKDGEMHGKFEIVFPDGDIIDAVYKNGSHIKSKYRDKIKPKKFKGEAVEKIEFIKSNYKSDDGVLRNRYYKGYVKVGWEHPHGEGDNVIRNKDKTIYSIEEGIFENGLLVKGTKIEYWSWCILKTIGKWKWNKDGSRHEGISGKGEEFYYKSEQDMKNNKTLGYIKATFDDGKVLKGEVLNPAKINYTDHDFVKKILIKKQFKNAHYISEYNTQGNFEKGEIFFENGDHYKGDFDGDMPHGIGTMTYKDGSKVKGKWYLGNFAKNN